MLNSRAIPAMIYNMMAVDTARALWETNPVTCPNCTTIPIKVWLQGGLQGIFSDKKDENNYPIPKHAIDVALPVSFSNAATVGSLIVHLTETYLSKSPERHRFSVVGMLSVGILVVINEEDWEIPGKEEAQLEAGDEVFFISTMHGG